MKKHADYVAGEHSYWIHFCFGFVIGLALGGFAAWKIFDATSVSVFVALFVAVWAALEAGRWGDRGLRRILERWSWFT